MSARADERARLHGRWLVVARALWIGLAAPMVMISVGFVPLHWAQLADLFARDAVALAQLGLTVELAVGFRIATGLVLLLGSVALALLVFRQRSDDWLALLTALMTLSIGALFNGLSALTVVPPAWDASASFVRITAPLLFFVTTFLFPDGRWVPRGASVVATLSTVYVLSWVVFPDSPLNVYRLDKWPLAPIVVVVWMALGLLDQIYRYRHASHITQRQQTKWIVFGWLLSTVFFAFAFLPSALFPVLNAEGMPRLLNNLFAEPTFQMALFVAQVSAAISILRYRLFDIDILIRRTLIYSMMTALLALVYFGGVLLLQQLFRALTGQQSELAIIISTLGIAVLFNPLRSRVKNAIDRRFYRRKYDAQQVLANFAAMARDEVDLNRLTERWLDVVDETMQPTRMSLWLKPQANRTISSHFQNKE